MLDLLTLDRNGRLVVIELKADEDLHLPMQALDYWIRVRALNDDRAAGAQPARPSFRHSSAQGYFPGAEVSPLPPRLLLAAPALRIHPANEPVLRYFSPQIEWELIALAEHWRREFERSLPQTQRTPLNPGRVPVQCRWGAQVPRFGVLGGMWAGPNRSHPRTLQDTRTNPVRTARHPDRTKAHDEISCRRYPERN